MTIFGQITISPAHYNMLFRCSCWVHGECVGVDVNDIPDQYICAFCYAIMKQGIDW